MPALSIVVTSYNIENHIKACLDSIFAQTFSDFELIVVDDASTDGSVLMAEQACAGRQNCKIIRLKENTPGGAGAPSNVGIDAASGEYVGFVDGDDIAAPELFDELMNAARRNMSDVVMCKHKNFVENGIIRYKNPADAKRWAHLLKSEAVSGIEQFKLDVLKMISVPWRKIYRRDFLNQHNIRFPEGDYFYEDNPFHWFTTYHAERIALVPKELIFHRVDRAGQTMSMTDGRLLKMFLHFDTIQAFLETQDASRMFRAQLGRWAISQLEWISEQLDPTFRKQLYSDFARCMTVLGDDLVRDAVRLDPIGNRGAALTWFAMTRREERFLQYLDGSSWLSPAERWSISQLKSSGFAPVYQSARKIFSSPARLPELMGAALSKISHLSAGVARNEVSALRREVRLLQRMVLAQHLDLVEQRKQKGTAEPEKDIIASNNRYVPKSVAKRKHLDS